MSEVQIRPYRPGDEAAILATFNLVFREVCGPGFVDRTPELWRWQFAENPSGQRISLAVAADGTVAAQYAGVPYRLDTEHGTRTFIHIVDSFVHPAFRAGLKRPGLFVQTALPWFDDCFARGDAVLYGYPVPQAERIGQRYLEYHRLRVVDYLLLDLAGNAPAAPAAIEVRRGAAVPADLDALLGVVSRERRCWTRRDREYLDWRYVRCPGSPYEVHEARREGRLAGVMVLRPHHDLVPGACTIADWIVPSTDDEAISALLAAAHARGRQEQRRHVLAVLADPCAEHAAFRARGFAVVPSAQTLERRLTHRIYDQRFTSPWLAEHWWYTLGDSDLV